MMGSVGWNPEEAGIMPGQDEDLHHFLDMANMSSLPDALEFNFGDFEQSQAPHMMPHGMRQGIDTTMGGTESASRIIHTDTSVHTQGTPVTTSVGYGSVASHVMPQMTTADEIHDIDAQIQYLEQQRHRQQQRHIQEQQTFFDNTKQRVPPTPQSLEMLPGNDPYFRAGHRLQRNQHHMFDNSYQSNDHQEVCMLSD